MRLTPFQRLRLPSIVAVERTAERFGVSLTPDEIEHIRTSFLSSTVPLDQHLDAHMRQIQEGRA